MSLLWLSLLKGTCRFSVRAWGRAPVPHTARNPPGTVTPGVPVTPAHVSGYKEEQNQLLTAWLQNLGKSPCPKVIPYPAFESWFSHGAAPVSLTLCW